MHSFYWPESNMIGRHLRLSITRDTADSVSFRAYDARSGLLWWAGGARLPLEVGRAPLCHNETVRYFPAITPRSIALGWIAVKTVRESRDMQEPMGETQRHAVVDGLITRLQLWSHSDGMPVTHRQRDLSGPSARPWYLS